LVEICRAKAEERNRDRLDLAIKASELVRSIVTYPRQDYRNDKCKEDFWLSPEAEVNFDLFYSIIHPDDGNATRKVFMDEVYDIEYRTVAPDGRTRWVRAIGNCFYDESNNPIRFDGITIDVTDRKRQRGTRKAFESERAARSEAERASRLKDEFLLTLSHESDTAQCHTRLVTKQFTGYARHTDSIPSNVTFVQAQLIDDLLDMSRIIPGRSGSMCSVELVQVEAPLKNFVCQQKQGSSPAGSRSSLVSYQVTQHACSR